MYLKLPLSFNVFALIVSESFCKKSNLCNIDYDTLACLYKIHVVFCLDEITITLRSIGPDQNSAKKKQK